MSRVNRDLVASAMMSSIENYLFEILDSVENEVGALTAEDHYEINSLVRCAIEKASTELGACSMTDITRLLASLKRRSAHAKEFGDSITFVKLKDIDALVEALEKAQQLETQAAEMAIQISKRLAEAYKRVTELESRTVTVKLPPKIERNDADGWFMYNGGRVGGGAAEWYNKALDDVGSELTGSGIKWEAE